MTSQLSSENTEECITLKHPFVSLPCEGNYSIQEWGDFKNVLEDDSLPQEKTQTAFPLCNQVEVFCKGHCLFLLDLIIEQSGRVQEMLMLAFASGLSLLENLTSKMPGLKINDIEESENDKFGNPISFDLAGLFKVGGDDLVNSKLLELDTQITSLSNLLRLKIEKEEVKIILLQHPLKMIHASISDPAVELNDVITNTMLRLNTAFNIMEKIVRCSFTISLQPKI